MSDWETDVRSLEVDRCMSETNYEHEVGDIMTVRVEVLRKELGRGSTARVRRTFRYQVRDGVAEVRAVEPTNPDRSHEQGRMRVRHIAPMEREAAHAVRDAVPEVEAVRALSGTLRNERAKHEGEHPHANTDEHEVEA